MINMGMFWQSKKLNKIGRKLSVCLLCICMLAAAGCGAEKNENLRVVLTTGFADDEVFKIEKSVCTVPEIMVYLTTMQNQYESVYGSEIWNTTVNGVSLEQNVKDNALAKMAQVKTMNLMAQDYQMALTRGESDLVEKAAEEYFGSLNETEISAMGVTLDTIVKLYTEYALAQKIYHYIIKDINPEVSDDEARTITVQHILVKTYAKDGTGKKIPYTANARRRAKEKISEVSELLQEEADFDEMIRKYSEDEVSTISFGKGEMDPAFEKAAFNLGNNEISEIVETQDGYEIIKCLSTFDKNETDANKVKIVEQKREEVFGEQYDAYVESLTRQLNEKLWDGISFIKNDQVTTADFYDVFRKYCDGIGK